MNEVLRAESRKRSVVGVVAKRLLQAIAFVVILPRLLAYGVASLMLGKSRAFANASEGVGKIPGVRGLFLRQAFYRSTLAECGRDVYFGWLCAFSSPTARVGEGVYVGRRCGLGVVTVGENAMLADGVQVLSGGHQHGTDRTAGLDYRDQPQEYRRVEIGAGAWLGAGTVVMADVGSQAVVGAGAVVTRTVEPRTVVAGVPAKVVRPAEPDPPTA